MFCPKCGSSNPEETSYCRSCGEDLGLISKAMARELPLVIADKIDGAIKRNSVIQLEWLKNMKRRATSEMLTGTAGFAVVLWFFLTGRGDPDFAFGLISVIMLYLIGIGLWDYRRARSLDASTDEERTGKLQGRTTKELTPPNFTERPSITEDATRQFDEVRSRPGK